MATKTQSQPTTPLADAIAKAKAAQAANAEAKAAMTQAYNEAYAAAARALSTLGVSTSIFVAAHAFALDITTRGTKA